MALADSLVSYWKFDESSGDAADSVASNTLTNNNATAFASGLINNGADLEATSNNSFQIADASQTGLDITGDLTQQFWVKVESNPADGGTYGLMCKRGAAGTTIQYVSFYDNNGGVYKINVEFRDSSDNRTFGSLTQQLTPGSWFHIVVVITVGTPQIDVYVNASQNTLSLSGSAATSIRDSTGLFMIGDAIAAATIPFDGLVDECAIWSRALTSGEVSQLYNGGVGLQYPFTTGTTIFPRRMMRGIGQ